MSLLDQSLGQLARDIPGVTAVFHKYQLDFCCGGKQSLRAAAVKRALDVTVLEIELNGLRLSEGTELSWADMPDAELIEHILIRYHDVHRKQLPELIRLAQRVERVHGARPKCPTGLAYHLEQMHAELEAHMQKEEEIVFPMISRGLQSSAMQPISAMRQEHDEHGEALAVIDRLTYGITPPEDACNTWRALYLGLETLKRDLMNHIHLENNILFDRVDGQLEDIENG